jgi:hypothetical protein
VGPMAQCGADSARFCWSAPVARARWGKRQNCPGERCGVTSAGISGYPLPDGQAGADWVDGGGGG